MQILIDCIIMANWWDILRIHRWKHYFGPFEDSMVKIYAVQDKQGNP